MPPDLVADQRGCNWSLRVHLLDAGGNVLFTDTSGVATLTIVSPGQQQPDKALPPGGSGGHNREPAPPVPPPPIPPSRQENAEYIRNYLAANPGADQVVLRLEDGVSGIHLFGSTLNMLLNAGADGVALVIETENGTRLTICPDLINEMLGYIHPFSA